ncbi:GPR1/FUN34/YaaH family transporter [uncultured Jatrophihabitans sp.]|uniref:GPR1/FUN34/YaaH family transporter n=1 Tax=uncultured Jatrophihabitans sp. TaxID=1610747 RepID=UPI0035CAE8E3
MTNVDPNPRPGGGATEQDVAPHPSPSHAAPEPVADAYASPVPVANAALVGVPTFLVGSIALGLNLVDYVPQGIVGAPIAIIAMATGLGQVIATIFALKAGESAVASVFGIFGGFWLSYAALVLGILHNWFGFTTPPAGASASQAASAAVTAIDDSVKTFLLAWLILIVILTLASIRLPAAFTLLFALVDVALLFVYLAYHNASAGVPDSGQLKTGGVFVFAFVAVGAYLFFDAMFAATGGKNLPLGRPVLK